MYLRLLSQQLIKVWKQRVSKNILPLLSTVWLSGIGLALLALWGFAEIADEVLEQETRAFEQGLLLALAQIHRPWLDQTMVWITACGDSLALIILGSIFFSILLISRQKATATTFVVAALGVMSLNFFLKAIFARDRPQLWERIVDVNYYSFPSGHAMISLVIYGFIGYWLVVYKDFWPRITTTLTLIFIGLIGFSRLYLGVHWPTDVLAGYGAGFVWLITCLGSLELAKRFVAKQK